MANILHIAEGDREFLVRLNLLALRVLVDMDVKNKLQVASCVATFVFPSHDEDLTILGHGGCAFA